MKAMVLTGIRQMEMREWPEPMIINDTDVKIKMKRLGVCGSDVHYYTTGRIGSQVVDYPFPVGHEGAGIVTETGSKVTRVKPGDEIAIDPAMPCNNCEQCRAGRHHTCLNQKFLGCPGQADGSLSGYIVMPESSCFPLTKKLSLDHGALSEPLSIGLYALQQSIPIQGKRIGILGMGPIGMSVLLPVMMNNPASVYVTDKIDARLRMADEQGVTLTANPDKEDIEKIIQDAEPNGLDVVFECCGQQEAADNALNLLKPGGKLMIIGIPEFDRWTFSADYMRRKEICIQNVRRQLNCVQPVLDMIENSSIRPDHMVTHRFPFSKTREAFDMVADYRDGVMKAMIDFD